jgi:hypothetical protein
MTFMSICTSEGAVKNSPLFFAPLMANFMRKHTVVLQALAPCQFNVALAGVLSRL